MRFRRVSVTPSQVRIGLLTVLVLATFYNSILLTDRLNDRDKQIEAKDRYIETLVEGQSRNSDKCLTAIGEIQKDNRELVGAFKTLLVYLKRINVIVPEGLIPDLAADTSNIRAEGDDKNGDGRPDPKPRPRVDDDDPKGQNPGKGNSGNGGNNGGGNDSDDGSDDKPGKSDDKSHGQNKGGKSDEHKSDKGKDKDKK